MLDKKTEHGVFGKCWNMFNTVRKNPTDRGWETCVNEAHKIMVSVNGFEKFHEKLVLAVIEEAEFEEKCKDAQDKAAAYKDAGAAFQNAWEMFSRFIENPDKFKESGMDVLNEYNKAYKSRFAKKLSSAIYEVVCADNNFPGAFMNDAYTFYQEFQNGITPDMEADAYAKAEHVIDMHPEHMLQMMEMYADLKAKGKVVAA